MDISIHRKKAYRLFDSLIERYEEGRYPYVNITLPQRKENLPAGLSEKPRLHACYLFFACIWMRGPISSEFAFRKLRDLWKYDAELFDPAKVGGSSPEQLKRRLVAALDAVSFNYHKKQAAQFWALNSRKLYWHWHADPRELFAHAKDYADLKSLLAAETGAKSSPGVPWGFKGFGEKMVSMLAYFFMDAQLIEEGAMPAPIDFHLLRVLTACEMLTLKPEPDDYFTQEYVAAARKLTEGYCRDKDVSLINLTEALWLLSRDRCSQNPGNKMRRGEYRGRSTELEDVEVQWGAAEVESFNHSCRYCPLREACMWNIPSAYYYVQGKLKKLSQRKEPPRVSGVLFSSLE